MKFAISLPRSGELITTYFSKVSESSNFKVYTNNNCLYECHVRLAAQKCNCIPWDYIGSKEVLALEECNIFGRSCFKDVMEYYTIISSDPCKRSCKSECNYIKYEKTIAESRNINPSPVNGGKFYRIEIGM